MIHIFYSTAFQSHLVVNEFSCVHTSIFLGVEARAPDLIQKIFDESDVISKNTWLDKLEVAMAETGSLNNRTADTKHLKSIIGGDLLTRDLPSRR